MPAKSAGFLTCSPKHAENIPGRYLPLVETRLKLQVVTRCCSESAVRLRARTLPFLNRCLGLLSRA